MFKPFFDQNKLKFTVDKETFSGSALCVTLSLANSLEDSDVKSILRLLLEKAREELGLNYEGAVKCLKGGNDLGLAQKYFSTKKIPNLFKDKECTLRALDQGLSGWNHLLMAGVGGGAKLWLNHCVAWRQTGKSTERGRDGILYNSLLRESEPFFLGNDFNFSQLHVLALRL
jgi:hypothetical protein